MSYTFIENECPTDALSQISLGYYQIYLDAYQAHSFISTKHTVLVQQLLQESNIPQHP